MGERSPMTHHQIRYAMANKHMKRCSASQVFGQLQIKTRNQRAPIRMAEFQNTDTTKYWWECGATGTLIHWWRAGKMGQPVWEAMWWFLTKLNILMPDNPAVTLLSVYPEELKTSIHTKTCTNVDSNFSPHCQTLEAAKMSARRWMYIQTMEYHSVIKRNALASHGKTGRVLNAYFLV